MHLPVLDAAEHEELAAFGVDPEAALRFRTGVVSAEADAAFLLGIRGAGGI